MGSDQGIITELQAPVKSFRLFALEQAITNGDSPELLKALEDAQRREADEECLCLLPHALAAVRSRLAAKTGGAAPQPFGGQPVTAGAIPGLFAGADTQGRLQILLHLPWKILPDLIPWALETLRTESHPAILSQLIRVFGKQLTPDQAQPLLELVFSGFVTVRCGALETLAVTAPHLLTPSLPRLLQDADPRVLAVAIKALARLDAEEARRHITRELMGTDPARKLEILKAAVVLPLDTVKGPILQFLAAEPDLALIGKAGLLLQINPDPDVPYRLLEIMARADPPKVAVLQTILEGACQIIRHSDFLGNEFPAFLARLEEAVRKRSVFQQVQIAVTNLDSEDAADRVEGEAVLARQSDAGLLKDALAEAGSRAVSPEAKAQIQATLAPVASPPPAPPPAPMSPAAFEIGRFLALSPTDQSRWLARLRPEDGQTAAPAIGTVIRSDRTDNQVKAVALRAAARLALGGFTDIARQWALATDESMVIAALEYLGRFDSEKTLQMLGRFHTSPSVRVRIAAMKILMSHDPAQAVSLVMAILKNPNPRIKGSAISCLMSFDFSLIRGFLVDFLEASRDPELLAGVLLLFQNNPDPENLFLLYRLEKCFSGEDADKVRAVLEGNVSLIGVLKLVEPAALKSLVATFPATWAQFQEKKAATGGGAGGRGSWSRAASGSHAWRESLVQVALLCCLGIVVFSGLWVIGGVLFQPEAAVKKVESGGLLAVPVEIEASVTSVLSEIGELQITATDKTVFQLAISGEARTLKVGDRIKAVIKPFRRNEAMIFARFLVFSRI